MFSKGKYGKTNVQTSPGPRYFNHYPTNFLKPYGLVDDPPQKGMICRRIHPISCEWLKGPKVAMSEFSETIIEKHHMAARRGTHTRQSNKVLQKCYSH